LHLNPPVSWVFQFAPWLVLVTSLAAALLSPIVPGYSPISFSYDFIYFTYLLGLGRVFMILGALDTGSSFEGMGASREATFSALIEPILLFAVGTLDIIFPGSLYQKIPIKPVIEESGDCWARALVRIQEIDESLLWLSSALQMVRQQNLIPESSGEPVLKKLKVWEPKRSSFSIALIEGWRGEVMHYMETNSDGSLAHYKIQDPSLRNWFAVALAVRNNDISDFPICNKSFDLSYCGQDL